MKKLLLLLPIMLLLLSMQPGPTQSGEPKGKEQKVLICNSKSSYAYHNKYCRGLKQCKSDVREVSVEQAKKMGKGKPCGYCYGR